MITVVIPTIDYHYFTNKALSRAKEHAFYVNEYIVIDNNSDIPYENTWYSIIRNEENLGGIESIKQALDFAQNDIVLVMHNDVLIHEEKWDRRIIEAFEKDPHLAIAGFFGAKGIFYDGGRLLSESNMLGKEVGTNWSIHGNNQTGISPATVLDGLALVFKRSVWMNIEIPQLALHHFYDKILPLLAISKGYHCATIGIAFDHGLPEGVHSVANASDIYHDSARVWAKENNVNLINDNPDLTMYNYNKKILFDLFGEHFPIFAYDTSTNRIQYTYISNVPVTIKKEGSVTVCTIPEFRVLQYSKEE